MLTRILLSMALLYIGFYIGREIGRADPIRKQLADLNKANPQNLPPPQ